MTQEQKHAVEKMFREAKANEKTLAMLFQLAKNDDPDALCYVAEMYATGNGFAQDITTAVELYKRAAGTGDPHGEYEYAVCCANGEDEGETDQKAVELFLDSASKGYSPAMLEMGLRFADGRGVPQDFGMAFYWYMQGAAAGNCDAAYFLGLSYRDGEGVEKNLFEAEKWFRKAADGGNTDAMVAVVCDLLGTNSKDPNYEPSYENLMEARRLAQIAADMGNTEAYYYLALFYIYDTPASTIDYEKAYKYLELSANNGFEAAQELMKHFTKNFWGKIIFK